MDEKATVSKQKLNNPNGKCKSNQRKVSSQVIIYCNL